jgi:hypothetical protein
LQVQIDIKPGSTDNTINLGSNGTISVAILTTQTFNAFWVDVASVRFASASAFAFQFKDVDNDGDLDLLLNFRTQDTNLLALYEDLLVDDFDEDGVLDSTRQEATASLFGLTTTNELFQGEDELNLFLSGRALRDLLDELYATGALTP